MREPIFMTAGLLVMAVLAGRAHAQATAQWGEGGTMAAIRPGANCAAEIIIPNRRVDTGGEYDVTLSVNGLVVALHASIRGPVSGLLSEDAGDYITITPPEGFLALPDAILVPEDTTATVLICSADGVGA